MEISDCKDMDGWHEHCQTMLNAVYGLDYEQFCKFLLHIMFIRIDHLCKDNNTNVYDDCFPGENHLKFDLQQAKSILLELKADDDFIKLKYFLISEQSIISVLKQADNFLCD